MKDFIDTCLDTGLAHPDQQPLLADIAGQWNDLQKLERLRDELHQQKMDQIRADHQQNIAEIQARIDLYRIRDAIMDECAPRNLNHTLVVPVLEPHCTMIDDELSIVINNVWHSFEDALDALFPDNEDFN